MRTIAEFEAVARQRLEPAHYDYYAGGAQDEITLAENESAFRKLKLLPRVLRGSDKRDLSIELLGSQASMPILIAPTAFHRLAHADGELATARAAALAGTIMIVSMASTTAIEDVAAAAREVAPDPALWFQLYLQPDLEFTEAIVRRAEAHAASRRSSSPWTRRCSAAASATTATTSTTCRRDLPSRTCAISARTAAAATPATSATSSCRPG